MGLGGRGPAGPSTAKKYLFLRSRPLQKRPLFERLGREGPEGPSTKKTLFRRVEGGARGRGPRGPLQKKLYLEGRKGGPEGGARGAPYKKTLFRGVERGARQFIISRGSKPFQRQKIKIYTLLGPPRAPRAPGPPGAAVAAAG